MDVHDSRLEEAAERKTAEEDDVDESAVRERAEAHGRATVAGDLKAAGNDLTPEAMNQAPGVMGKMPSPLKGSEVESLEASGDDWVAVLRYVGEDGELKVKSRWAERDGRPRIVDLEVL